MSGSTSRAASRTFKLVAVAALVAGIALIAGSARADTGTYSGSITPTACGPMHPVNVAAGETTIDATAAATVSANDITLDLYSPGGQLLVHGDTLTSPESVHYAAENLPAGTYNLQVCPFLGGVLAEPYSYTGTFATSDAPVVGPPGPLRVARERRRHQAMSPASSSSVPRLSWMLSEPKASR